MLLCLKTWHLHLLLTRHTCGTERFTACHSHAGALVRTVPSARSGLVPHALVTNCPPPPSPAHLHPLPSLSVCSRIAPFRTSHGKPFDRRRNLLMLLFYFVNNSNLAIRNFYYNFFASAVTFQFKCEHLEGTDHVFSYLHSCIYLSCHNSVL